MEYVKNCLIGVLIGAGAIIPGVSSGVLCVIFGIYEKLLDSVLNIFKDFKNNFQFLFPITVGAVIGIVAFGNILKYFFYEYPYQTSLLFMGLVIGSIPNLIKEVNSKFKFKASYIIYLLIALVIGISAVWLESVIQIENQETVSLIYLIMAGMLMSIGVVIPGISSTVILMLLGVYGTYLSSVALLYFPVLIPMGIGLVIGSIICMKIIKKMLDRFYAQTFYLIIGFTLGSVLILYQDITLDLNGISSILCFMLGAMIASELNHNSQKNHKIIK